jgi:hypothetical protein
MEITVYTRHSNGCPYEDDRYSRRCKCRKWLQYMRNGEPVRESAKTRSWDAATKLARQMEREDEQRRLGAAPAPGYQILPLQDQVGTVVAAPLRPKHEATNTKWTTKKSTLLGARCASTLLH